jgi:DNA invertase Pin-like site-specific DNA recombinase
MLQAGIYARISVKKESRKEESIRHQILLARDWILQQPDVEEYRCYTDSGYTGTNFCRPAFQEMMEDARHQNIQCIICKDASRLGRNYLEVGEYMEQIFPSLGIRFVCISEGYDSAREMPGSLGMNLRNLMYQWYAKDIGRKVRLVKQQKKQRGEYLGSRPPYGYCIVYEKGKRLLKKDERAGKIVEEIISWHGEGMSLREIRDRLVEQGVHSPNIYYKTGCVYGEKGNVTPWDCSTIRFLLSHSRGDYDTT